MSVAAVVLAAGASTRMGRPKALIEWRGRPFVVHCVEVARAAGCERVIVVEGAVPLPALEATLVTNDVWEHGPLSSVQAGLHALMSDPPSGVVVLTVDRPHVREATVRALVDTHRERPDVFLQPIVSGKRGHPVVYPWDLACALLVLDPWDTPRTLLSRPEIATRRAQLDVDDPAVLDNLDTPQDVARLIGQDTSKSIERD